MSAARTIHSRSSAREIPDLLQAIFAAELVSPSRCLWLVSPWISDIPILDNRTWSFVSLDPTWPRAIISFSKVLTCLAQAGTTIQVVTRPDTHNREFLGRLERAREQLGIPVFTQQVETLHEKGLLGDRFYLSGSMNFTHNGVSLNEEAVHLFVDPATLAVEHLHFFQRWGGTV